jgi:uncharacterized protein (TIGR03083 family)
MPGCPVTAATVEVALKRTELAGYDPFGIFDAEAMRLDRFFGSLDGGTWLQPSRCAGWSIRDVLAHLAGEEAYNHACLNGDLGGFFAWLRPEGVAGEGFGEFNEWSVRARRHVPTDEVLAEWRTANAQTRHRMRQLGEGGTLQTSAGPYSAGLQALHYASELATHADDVCVPIRPAEEGACTRWRAVFGAFALGEQGRPVRVKLAGGTARISGEGQGAELSEHDFVEATVGRLAGGAAVPARLRAMLCCLA